MIRHLASLLAVLLISACTPDSDDRPCAALIGGGSYCLQPTTLIPPFEMQQKVEASIRGHRETLIVELEADANGLRFVGLTPFGHKLLEVSYDNRLVTASALPDPRLSPSLLIALLQLSLWPADTVRSGLQHPLTLEDSPTQRRIMKYDEPLLTIDYQGTSTQRRLHAILHAVNIELDIETLPPQANEP